MCAVSKPKVREIRVTTTRRDSQHPDGVVVSVEVLRPLSAEERKAGRKDKFAAWIRKHGDGTSKRSARQRHPSDWWDKVEPVEKEHAAIDPYIQLEIAKTMAADFDRLANKLIQQSHISPSDRDYYMGLMFDACRDAYPKFDPDKRSLRGFMKDILKKWRLDLLDYLNAESRKGDFTKMSMRVVINPEDEDGEEETEARTIGGIYTPTISEEAIPHPRSIRDFEFKTTMSDLVSMCEPDELLTLKLLYRGGTMTEVAEVLNMSLASARRNVLGSLQLKVDLCFGFTDNGLKLDFIRK